MRFPQSLLQAEQLQLSLPVFIGEVLQLSDHINDPSLDSIQQYHVLVLSTPDMDTILQVGSHWSRVEEKNNSFGAAQDKIFLLDWKVLT